MKHVGYIFVGLKWIFGLVLIVAMIGFTAANAWPVFWAVFILICAYGLGLLLAVDKREAEHDLAIHRELNERKRWEGRPPPPEDE